MKFKELKALTFITQFGIIIIANVGIGLFIGLMLDNWLNTKPWLMILFIIAGIANSFRSVYQLAMGDADDGKTTKSSND